MRETLVPGIFYEEGGGYVLCGWPSRISIKVLTKVWKDAARATPTVMRRIEKSKLFHFEGPKEQVMAILKTALDWRLAWLDRHPDEGRELCQR